MTQTYEQIPQIEQEKIKAALESHLKGMTDADKKIAERTYGSLAVYIAEVVRTAAKLLGFVIALPIAFAAKMAANFTEGFSSGWNQAWKEMDF